MSNKNKNKSGMVYSTNPDFDILNDSSDHDVNQLAPHQQNLLIRKSTQGRAGKVATVIQRFKGSTEALESLTAQIKKHIGTGGTCKDGEIIIQGDVKEKVHQFLTKLGYKSKIG